MGLEALYILLFVLNVSLISIVYTYNPAGVINRFLALLLIPDTLTYLEMLLLYSAREEIPFTIGLYMAFWGVIIFFPLFYHFSFYFPRKRINEKTKIKLWIIYAVPVIIGIPNIITYSASLELPSFQEIFIFPFRYAGASVYYITHFSITIYIIVLVVLTSRRLILSLRSPGRLLPRERKMVTLILVGFIPLSFLGLFSYALFLPLEQGAVFFLILSIIQTAYYSFLIFEFGFIEIKSLLRIFIFFPVFLGAVFVLHFSVLSAINPILIDLLNISASFLFSLEVFLLGLIFLPFRKFVENISNKFILPIPESFHDRLTRASEELTRVIDLFDLERMVKNIFLEELKVRVFYLLLESQREQFETISSAGPKEKISFPFNGELANKLRREKRIQDIQQIALSWFTGKELQVLDEHGVTLVVPLLQENKLLGICLLGEIGKGRNWHSAEIDILELFMANLVSGIIRCRLHHNSIEMEKRQARIEKMAVLHEVTSGMAHEIRNPLSIISTSAETILQKDLSPQDLKRLAEYIRDETERMSVLLDRILSFAPHTELRKHSANVSEFVSRAFDLLGTQIRRKNIHLTVSCHEEYCTAWMDRDALMQLLLNMAINAIEACFSGGEIVVSIKRKENMVEVLFANNGEPIDENEKEEIFFPFYTTKEKGTGLGLSISSRLVKDAGGSLELVEDGKYTGMIVFRIVLPAEEMEKWIEVR